MLSANFFSFFPVIVQSVLHKRAMLTNTNVFILVLNRLHVNSVAGNFVKDLNNLGMRQHIYIEEINVLKYLINF